MNGCLRLTKLFIENNLENNIMRFDHNIKIDNKEFKWKEIACFSKFLINLLTRYELKTNNMIKKEKRNLIFYNITNKFERLFDKIQSFFKILIEKVVCLKQLLVDFFEEFLKEKKTKSKLRRKWKIIKINNLFYENDCIIDEQEEHTMIT